VNHFESDSRATRVSLLSRVRDTANHAAWQEFEIRYRELLIRFCRRRGLQRADAEDVTQIIFLNLARSLPGFVYDPQRGRFRSYLYRVAKNAIQRFIECPDTARTALEVSELEAIAVDDDDPLDEIWEQEWADHHYRLAMKQLRQVVDPRTVQVFERLVSGATTAQASEEFGMKADAVDKVRQRVRARLQKLIAEQVREEDEIVEGVDRGTPPAPAENP
jgi:RNA polymerase sigma-70 factor (ECF subfamily)